MGLDGYYTELEHPVGYGDGTVDYYTEGENVYALRVKGDSMHPVIRAGQYLVVDPTTSCTPGEFVVVSLTDGRKTVKELVYERPDEVVLEAANGGARITIPRVEIEWMHAVAAVIAASRWRPE